MLIAIPTNAPGGLDAPISAHFGHCDAFTVVELSAEGEIGEVKVHDNTGHDQGGCMAPVMVLKQLGVDALLAGGMGMRPLAGFRQVGIKVHSKADADTVREAVELYAGGDCPEFGDSQTCGGGGGGCGGHDHEHEHEQQLKVVPIEGKADVREGRLVTMNVEVRDSEGAKLDSSLKSGPMHYLQGSGGIVGLEKAIEGHEAGESLSATISPAEGFGERDEERVLEVPTGQLPPNVEIGQMLMAEAEDGRQLPLSVLEIGEETARLDANHPLAGKELTFEVEIVKVEEVIPNE